MYRFPIGLLAALVSIFVPLNEACGHEGWGIVRDASGRIYIADIPANTIWRIGGTGQIEAVLRDTHSHALAIGSDGAVYGTNVHLSQPIRSAWRLDMTGRMTTVIPSTRGLPLDLQAFLLSVDGTIYSVTPHESSLPADQRSLFLVRRTPLGVIDTVASGRKGHADGRGREARFTTIDGMAWLPDSSMLLVEGPHLRRMTRDGVVATVIRDLTTTQWDQDVMGVSVGQDGVAYVADFAARRVLRAGPAGVATVSRTGWYWSPTGVLASTDGIYTLDHPRAPLGILGDLGVGPYLRVRLIRTDGSTETVTRMWGRHTTPLAAVLAGILILVFAVRAWRRR